MKRISTFLIAIALLIGMFSCASPAIEVPVLYSIDISSTEGGQVTVPGEGIFACSPGLVIKLVAIADPGYRFVSWVIDIGTVAEPNAAETTVAVDSDCSVVASFEEIPKYNVSITSTSGGSVTAPGEGSFTYEEGTVVSLVAIPVDGYEFVYWTGDVGTVSSVSTAGTTIAVYGDYNVVANFQTIPDYDLAIASTAGGNVTAPGEGTFSYTRGTLVSLVAEPDEGYQFVNWVGDVGTIAAVNARSTTVMINGNYSVTANFEEENFDPTQWVIRLHRDNVILVQAQPARGFYWDYYLFVPANAVNNQGAHMLVEPNNTGTRSDAMEVHDQRARSLVEPGRYPRTMAEGLNTPLLVPVFPRPATNPAGAEYHAYPHALDRDTLLITEETLRRVDLQLLAMIDHAQSVLRANGILVARKVFMHGFSASGNYLTRFALIHPERVRAVAAGGLNGMPTLPLGSWDRWSYLRYPIGIADLQELTGKHFDLEAFKGVSQYWYMGYLDKNDTLPYSECYAPQDASLLRAMLGEEILDRWEQSQQIYEYAGVPAQFVTYYQTAHSIRTEMIQDIVRFFKANAGDEIVHIVPHQYPYVPYQELQEVTIISAVWYEDPQYPSGMRQYYSDNSFAVYAREWIEWQDYTQMAKFVRENLPEEGRVIYLLAPDGASVQARATGGTSSLAPRGSDPGWRAFIFEVDQDDLCLIQPGVPYQLQPVKASDIYYFTVQDGVTLTRG